MNAYGEDGLTIINGDCITIEPAHDGELSIKISDAVFGAEARWLHIAVEGRHDRDKAIDSLIDALSELRDR